MFSRSSLPREAHTSLGKDLGLSKSNCRQYNGFERCLISEAFFWEQRLKVQTPELPPVMGRFLPRSPEVSVQAPGSTSHMKLELSPPENPKKQQKTSQ